MSRLIDADDLINGYKHMGYDPTEHPEESYMEGWCKGFNAAVDHCMHHVIHAPTIEPQHIKGRWKRTKANSGYNAEWVCSNCGYTVYAEFCNYNYCSSCGSDMRGD